VSFCQKFWRSRFQSLSDARLRIAVVGNRKYLRDLVESIITSCVEFFDHRPIDFYFLPECHSVTCTPLRKRLHANTTALHPINLPPMQLLPFVPLVVPRPDGTKVDVI
jgi:hypothetical protein